MFNHLLSQKRPAAPLSATEKRNCGSWGLRAVEMAGDSLPHAPSCSAEGGTRRTAALIGAVAAFPAGTVALLPRKWEQRCWSGGFDFHCLSGSLPIG